MIDIVSGDMSKDRDWAQVWSDSDLCKEQMAELEKLKDSGSKVDNHREDDGDEYASSTVTQLKLVTKRASIQLWRDTEYVVNKVMLHIGSALFNGFSFWMIGNAYADLQNRIFTIFQFIFVARKFLPSPSCRMHADGKQPESLPRLSPNSSPIEISLKPARRKPSSTLGGHSVSVKSSPRSRTS